MLDKIKLMTNFFKRLENAQQNFEYNKNTPLALKMLELYNISPSCLFSLFSKIGDVGFDSIEEIECFNHIVDFFYKDGYLDIVWEYPDFIKEQYLCPPSYIKKSPFVKWGSSTTRAPESTKYLDEKQVIDVIDEIIINERDFINLLYGGPGWA